MKKIAIHSVPRSGSTWLGTIFDSNPETIYKYQPLFSYEFKDFLNEHSSKERMDVFFSKISDCKSDFLDQVEAKKKRIIPVFPKAESTTAIVYKEVRYHHILENMLNKHDELKVIGLVRDPISTIYSWYKAPREFRSDLGWKIEEEWRLASKKNEHKKEEFNGYEKWKEVTLLFERLNLLYPERFKLIKYDELLSDTKYVVKNLFDFVNLSYSNQTIKYLEESTSREVLDAYGVFKTKKADKDWKGNFNQEIIDFIKKDVSGTTLEKYLV